MFAGKLQEGKGCDADGSVCTDKDACQAGQCVAGPAVTCDDKNPCTTDSCDKAKGCQYAANSSSCDDGDACTNKDICSAKKCTGTPLEKSACDDKDPCTKDTCDQVAGCVHKPQPKVCDDGNACTVDTCVKGSGCKNAAVQDNTICSADQLKWCQAGTCMSKPLCGVGVANQCSLSGTAQGPNQLSALYATDAAKYDDFGRAVSIKGSRTVVGAWLDDDNGYQSGSAYVFEYQFGGGWKQVAKLVSSDGTGYDNFGFAVGVDGGRVVVGARGDNDNGSTSGSAYVFERQADGTWKQAAKLLAPDGFTNDQFGEAVAISGPHVVAGAKNHQVKQASGASLKTGAAYVYTRQIDGVWKLATKLVPSDGSFLDYFGYTVSISGEVAVVGAYGDDDKGDKSGSLRL